MSESNHECRSGVGRLEADKIFNFLPYLQVMKSQRTKVVTFLLGAAVLFLIAGIVVFTFFNFKTTTVSLKVRFLFDGADQGKYPNGSSFSAQELLSTVVLQEVYDVNQLKLYLPFEDFKSALTISQRNLDVSYDEADFNARLADPKVTPVDRDRLTREFREKMASMRNAEFSLTCIVPSGRTIPAVKLDKVLGDILSVWARDADLKKGALRYRVGILSPRMVKDSLVYLQEEPVILLDLLRNQISKVLGNIQEISALPGAYAIRDTNERDRLQDLRNRLMEMDRYQIVPQMRQIASLGLVRSHVVAMNYLESQMDQLSLEKTASQEKVKLLQESLQGYLQERRAVSPTAASPAESTTVIPQISADFFDKIAAMGQRSSDLEYRKTITDRIIEAGNSLVEIESQYKVYEFLLASLKSGAAASQPNDQFLKAFQARYEKLRDSLVQSLEEINQIYDRISKQNLHPDTHLYRITAPPAWTSFNKISLMRLAMYAFLYWLIVAAAGFAWLWFRVRGGKPFGQPVAAAEPSA